MATKIAAKKKKIQDKLTAAKQRYQQRLHQLRRLEAAWKQKQRQLEKDMQTWDARRDKERASLETMHRQLSQVHRASSVAPLPLAHMPPPAMAAPRPLQAPFDLDTACAAQFAWARYLGLETHYTNSWGMKFLLIPPGRFVMGSTNDELDRCDDENQVEVRISKPFYLAVFQVTQDQYEKIMGKNPSWFSPAGYFSKEKDTLNHRDFPVELVSWDDTIAFCNTLSEKDGITPYYSIVADQIDITDPWTSGYRLPTEAEWEYACRAGTLTPFSMGLSITGKEANINGSFPYGTPDTGPYLERTTTVGCYHANSFGLHDMHGNVWEWCFDGYENERCDSVDPMGQGSTRYRVLRGGSWSSYGKYCRSAYRARFLASSRANYRGFRVALNPITW